MRLGLTRIDQLLVSDVFMPTGGVREGHEHTVLVMGTEFGARLHRPDKKLSNGGRLIQHIADTLGVAALGYVRLGINGHRTAREMIDIRRALNVSNGSYDQTAADVGTILKKRLVQYRDRLRLPLDQPVLTCRSGAASFSASLARHNTIEARSAVLLELVGLHHFKRPFPTLKAALAMQRYHRLIEPYHPRPEKPTHERGYAEPVSRQMQYIDMLLYGDMAGSTQTKKDLLHVQIPTLVELGQYGLYSQIADPHDLTHDIAVANPAHILTHVRADATHAWYDASDTHSQAIRHGMQQLYAHFEGMPQPL